MATAGDGNPPYETTGAGGKFRKRPLRRSVPATPYARPPSAARNHNPSMLKKLVVEPASRLIYAGAHRLFDVFRKRPLVQSLGPPEINKEPQNVLQNEGGNVNSASVSAATGISELESLLQQKTFTRSEIERLTSVLHSKTTESPSNDSLEKRGAKRDNFHAAISTPIGTSGVLKEETASPAELAKHYMGSRQDSKLLPRTPITAVAQKTANSLGNLENGFATPRSRGRSAMYTMARAPYSRSPLSFSQQGIKSDYGHDAALTSSQGHEGKMALKRRSSVLDDDIGSGGPLRRIRQKANLLSQREKKELGYTTFQQPEDSGQYLLLTNASEPRGSDYASVPTKATQTANKILQHLDKPNSIENKSLSTLAGMNEKTPNKLRLDMLHGQALRSLEKADSPKLDSSFRDIQKPVVSELTLQSKSKDKTEENGLRKSTVSSNVLTLVNGDNDMPDTLKNKAPVVEFTYLPSNTEEPQKKHAFQMSAPEDYFEIDDDEDDVHDNGHVSLPLVENNKPETSAADIIKTPTLVEVSKTSELVEYNKAVFPAASKVPEQVELKEAENDNKPISSPLSPSVTTTQTSVLTNSTSQQENVASVKVSPFAFSANEPSEFKPNAGSDPKEIVPVSVFNSVTKNDHVKVSVFNKDENKMFGKSESLSAAVSAATSTDGIFAFGASNKNLSSLDTTPASNPPTFPSVAPFSASVSTTAMAPLSTTTTTPAVSFSTSVSPQVFSFGSVTSTAPSTSVVETGNTSTSSPFAITTFATTTTTTESGLFGFGSSAAATSTTTTGSGLFGFSSPTAATSTATTTTTGNGPFGFSSAAAAEATSTATTTTTATGNGLFGFSSPAAATSTTTTTTGNGLFGFSSPAAATTTTTASGLFGFSSPAAATSTTATTTGSGLFGFSSPAATTSTTITTNTTGGGLFGFSSPAAATSTTATTTVGNGLFGFSSPAAATSTTTTGSGLFGVSSSAAATSTTTAATGSGLFGFSSPAAATSTTTATGSGLFSFGSSAAAPSTTSSLSHGSFFNVTNGFQASTPASSTSTLFGSSAPAFSSTSSFGITSVGPASEIKSGNSTSGSTTSIFGSSWQQPQQSSGFGSTFTSSPSTSVFSFGASSTPASSFGPSVFGNSTPVFGATPNNNINNNNNNGDQMSMEDSMAEDSMQTQSPVSPFGQAPVSTTTPGFMFGSATPTPTPSLTPAPVSFSFGGQQNQAPAPQNPFQSSSVEFNAGGGSFSLGSGGEKSNRRIVRVMKSKNRKK
ncbi:hypothetical protein HanXRQr2_Chr08g0328331 [Helianthus annuus]|uniref:Uncharacterized protein n=1 Tax=Helianthus annuus TaxID=4232 RepID=A0A251U4W8_HELAN|nr:nuclear pore complex protein DDB_G0274915 [Helianthus annuus]KAF5794461.1 hypothetical protein HanXRQr2_Chr08g0328331 [Helianthus annuus]KAJ0545872.1 hypothetical protein HanIR_Chr08g0354591 [Helianthus annuus]KAJ0552730.1 hypothetical protein HanHA89_Chr08g0288411 [Helianthus annuus]KAJ0718410.1 hypothetical protein HanLR1_Chr08g0270261 [Helianthus annuus]